MTKELFTMFYAKFHWLINMSYISTIQINKTKCLKLGHIILNNKIKIRNIFSN